MVQEGPKHVGVTYKLWHFMFLINSAFVGKIFLYLNKECIHNNQILSYSAVVIFYRTRDHNVNILLYLLWTEFV
jgi:hypothetical protein